VLLNCDLGESYGNWRMGVDSEVMPHIDQANVACGYHAGDPVTMARTLAMAVEHGVTVGAHPAYPDLVGFGRRSIALSPEELVSSLHYQVGALAAMAAIAGTRVSYVKPHGALYNDMMANAEIRAAVLQAIATYPAELALMLQATPDYEQHRQEAGELGVPLLLEAFADRCYDDDGRLLSRRQAGAVHDRERMLAQVAQLADEGTITTVSGHTLSMPVDSLCVHGDNAEGVAAIRDIRAMLHRG
jgi:UPF0271 protein